MYVDNTGHPSTLGVYLNICVYYAVFSGKSPEGLDIQAREIPVSESNRAKYSDGQFMTLNEAAKRYLESVAWAAVQPYAEQNNRIVRGTQAGDK